LFSYIYQVRSAKKFFLGLCCWPLKPLLQLHAEPLQTVSPPDLAAALGRRSGTQGRFVPRPVVSLMHLLFVLLLLLGTAGPELRSDP
jgi:hypothetical protein